MDQKKKVIIDVFNNINNEKINNQEDNIDDIINNDNNIDEISNDLFTFIESTRDIFILNLSSSFNSHIQEMIDDLNDNVVFELFPQLVKKKKKISHK